MKKQKKFLIQILIFLLVLVSGYKVFAANIIDYLEPLEMSEDYKKYLELSDEEKEKVIIPRMYDIPKTHTKVNNPLKLALMLGATLETKYSLKDIIPENMVVKNQQSLGSCWAFSSLGSLESRLAVMNYKNGKNPIVYDFSERHMEYATSQTFKDGINKKGLNRTVGEGATLETAISYLTNGSGPIAEDEMKWENNNNPINLSDIENKKIAAQIDDIKKFPSYSSTEDKTQIKQQMKEYVKNYGGIVINVHGAQKTETDCYNNTTGALYCDDSTKYTINHAVLVVGWDDNYSINNFSENKRPQNNGAWICKNSWGTEERITLAEMKEIIFEQAKDQCIEAGWTSAELIPDEKAKETFTKMGYKIENDVAVSKTGDNGFIYVSYEDVNVYSNVIGIEKAQTEITYDNIYQYDEIGGNFYASFDTDKMYLATVFNKKTTKKEELTQVSINASETYTCKVYVNPNGTSKAKSDLQQVQLKTGETETFDSGYHTIEFEKPISITGDSFVVVIEIQGTRSNKISTMIEFNDLEYIQLTDDQNPYKYVTIENEKCFIASENDFNANNWTDTSNIKQSSNGNYPNFDTTIKAFTVIKEEENVLESIEISTPPTKTSYYVGENFDKTGMIVKAKYSDGTSKEITNYTIKDGTNLTKGKTSITIEYEGKTATQKITVETKTEETKRPENSNFDTMEGKVKNIKSYYFTDSSKTTYSVITLDISNIIVASGNDSLEYYYYLSSNPNETNIENWIKTEDLDKSDNKLTFEINTSDFSNYEEIAYYNDVYIYIKEVAKLNNLQQEKITPALELKTEGVAIEEYIDDEKKANIDPSTIENPTGGAQIDNTNSDNTLAPEIIPKAGKNMLIIGLILIMTVLGKVAYVKYKDIQIK